MIQFKKIKLRPALNAELPRDYLVSWLFSNSIFPRLLSGKSIIPLMIKVIKTWVTTIGYVIHTPCVNSDINNDVFT